MDSHSNDIHWHSFYDASSISYPPLTPKVNNSHEFADRSYNHASMNTNTHKHIGSNINKSILSFLALPSEHQILSSYELMGYPVYDENINYYHEFWRQYLENEVLITRMKENMTKSRETQAKIINIQNSNNEIQFLKNKRAQIRKKQRRASNEIEKIYLCPYMDCQRTYGSDVSLNLHIKIKHNGGNKTEREKLARTIREAQINNQELPEINLNLPPGFFQNINIDQSVRCSSEKELMAVDACLNTEMLNDSSIINPLYYKDMVCVDEHDDKSEIYNSNGFEAEMYAREEHDQLINNSKSFKKDKEDLNKYEDKES